MPNLVVLPQIFFTQYPGEFLLSTVLVVACSNSSSDNSDRPQYSRATPAVSNAGDPTSYLEMGLYFNGFSAPWTGSIFVDSVEVK